MRKGTRKPKVAPPKKEGKPSKSGPKTAETRPIPAHSVRK
jgi:hypothetical protein